MRLQPIFLNLHAALFFVDGGGLIMHHPATTKGSKDPGFSESEFSKKLIEAIRCHSINKFIDIGIDSDAFRCDSMQFDANRYGRTFGKLSF